jgi:D-sedoheptulose 7-phosphate isomerase
MPKDNPPNHSSNPQPANAETLRVKTIAIMQESLESHQRMLESSPPVLVQVAQAFIQSLRSGGVILLFGNGGSAADAQHVAAELVGRFQRERSPLPAIALNTNVSSLTAIGNDWEFSEIFARQVDALARPGDVVVGISTSGRSLNVVRGLQAGRRVGASTVAFSGALGRQVAAEADICFQAPHNQTARIQELHLLAWHIVCQLVEDELFPET